MATIANGRKAAIQLFERCKNEAVDLKASSAAEAAKNAWHLIVTTWRIVKEEQQSRYRVDEDEVL